MHMQFSKLIYVLVTFTTLFEGVTNSQVQNMRHASTIVQDVLTDSNSSIYVCCSVVRTIKNNQQTEFVQEITRFFGNVFCSVTFGNMRSTKYAAKDVPLLQKSHVMLG